MSRSSFKAFLDSAFLSTYGWFEVEQELRNRSMKAYETGSMEPLKQDIDLEWRNGSFKMSGSQLEASLRRKGLWTEIEKRIR